MLIPTAIVSAYAAVELFQWQMRRGARRAMYERALARSIVTEKPLLVVGDPEGGWTHGDYGCGDACVDLTGCPSCDVGHAVDLSTDALPFDDGSHVVFTPYVLEYVPNIDHAFAEMARVAGGKLAPAASSSFTRVEGRPLTNALDLFVLHLRDDELASRTYPGSRHVIHEAPQGRGGDFRYEPIARRFAIDERIARRR